MVSLGFLNNMSNEERYKYMLIMLEGQLSSESDTLANISNVTAIINSAISNCNWVGFYFLKEDELVLGPFQGLPACNRIKIGEGVCGTAVKEREIQRVEDVHKFEGHIACDSASNSEIVLPIIKDNKIYGVLDIDSPLYGRFTELEEQYLSKALALINSYVDWSKVI